jgi:cathepsin D
MSFFYSRSDGSSTSEMTIGGTNPDLYHGDIAYHDVVHEYYWTIIAEDIKLGDNSLGLCPT